MSARHQGLGGAPLGSDSPLFGGQGTSSADREVPATITRRSPIPPWDPRSDEYSSDSGTSEIESPEEAEAALAELRALLPADEAERSLDDWGRSERVISLVEPGPSSEIRARSILSTETSRPIM